MSDDRMPPLVQLAGVTRYRDEPLRCRLVFHLETRDGPRTVELTHGEVMDMLRFAEAEGSIPPLDPDWWARDGGHDGCAL